MTVTLITGASGFIGRRLVALFGGDPAQRVLALTHSGAGLACPLEALNGDFWARHQVERIDTLIHAAAFAPKTQSQAAEVAPIVKSNITGTAKLLASLPARPRRVVFVSSVDVYGQSAQVIDERSLPAPKTLFGSSKLFGEQIVRDYCSEQGCGYAIARLGHIYGPGEEAYSKLVPNLIRTMSDGEAPALSGTGASTRDLLYVDDAARALLQLARSPATFDPINVVSGRSFTIAEVAKAIAAAVGYDGVFRYAGSDERPYRFDPQLIGTVLDSATLTPLDAGLAAEIAHFRSISST